MAVDMPFDSKYSDYNLSFASDTPPGYSYELAFRGASYQLVPSKDQAMMNSTGSSWQPGHGRTYTGPETTPYMPGALAAPYNGSSSTLCSPITMTSSADAQLRRASSCSRIIAKYGFPTYRQMPPYILSTAGTEAFAPALYYTAPPSEHPQMLQLAPAPPISEPTTTLQAFLTAPNPAPSLVHQLNIDVHHPASKHFWWDIRQIRPWTSFTSTAITSTPGLAALLAVALPASSLPTPSAPRTTHTETETELAAMYASFYAAKLNAALAVAQGSRHLLMRAPTPSSTQDASFVSNYTDDTSAVIFGQGRVVGLVKSFDRWNSAMGVDVNHRRVAYLRGLAHLHHYMREHGCRYGFLITEMELVVVRNGVEATPHFGYLEVASVPLAETATPDADGGGVKMTALLALFYLHMLARDAPLAGQVGWKAEIGPPAKGTRRKCLPRDEWMPAPLLKETREAKRARGWVWSDERMGRKETGRGAVSARERRALLSLSGAATDYCNIRPA
ncbi:hypothetical protein V500_02829 [Pseudogymnoascus sp. VKM F-4518 (FW-2643)]|nr:hypothetical protein V500_02829 [Pseudogymnoascus sp. VKM F-4518 (FW-2643)]